MEHIIDLVEAAEHHRSGVALDSQFTNIFCISTYLWEWLLALVAKGGIILSFPVVLIKYPDKSSLGDEGLF